MFNHFATITFPRRYLLSMNNTVTSSRRDHLGAASVALPVVGRGSMVFFVLHKAATWLWLAGRVISMGWWVWCNIPELSATAAAGNEMTFISQK